MMTSDIIAVVLGLITVAILICFFIWRNHVRKTAASQLKEAFIKEDEHES